jgi:hypothetical protein
VCESVRVVWGVVLDEKSQFTKLFNSVDDCED